jgi:hypothetical protein
MTLLNSLVLGELCAVTTRGSRVVTGTFLGIEVAHGDRSILVRSPDRTSSIPIGSVLSTSGPSRRAA